MPYCLCIFDWTFQLVIAVLLILIQTIKCCNKIFVSLVFWFDV